jgi:hypothetical protein
MPFPSKLSPKLQQKNDENLSLGLTYIFAVNSISIIYQTFNE